MSYTRYSQNVGRRTSGTNFNANQSRSNFLQNNKFSQMTFPGTPDIKNSQARNVPFTRHSENRWSLGPADAHRQPEPPQPSNGYHYYTRAPTTGPGYGGQSQSRSRPVAAVQNYRQQQNVSTAVTPMQQYSNSTPIQTQQQQQQQQRQSQEPKVSVSVGGAPLGDNSGNGMAGLEGNPNVKYINLNWEDILGGKEGMAGMKVSMAPPPAGGDGNQNRQLQISFGNQGGNQPGSDGSVPLKILSFEPVKNYPGQMTPSGESQAPGSGPVVNQRPATSSKPPRQATRGHGLSSYSLQNRGPMQQPMQMTQSYTAQRNGKPHGIGVEMGMPRTASNSNCGNGNCAKCQFKQPVRPNRRR